jgi:hypothetical protein
MVNARNHGGGVDSGGMAEELGFYARSLATWTCGPHNIAGVTPLPQLLYGAASALPDAIVLLTKSLCTLQALVSNMEESGELTDGLKACPFCGDAMVWLDDAADEPVFAHEETNIMGATCFLRTAIFRAEQLDAWNDRTAVLGTFDLEALKTLVGEIDDVLGGTE